MDPLWGWHRQHWWYHMPASSKSVGARSRGCRDILAASPRLTQGLAGAQRITSVHTAANFSYRISPVVGDRYLAVGDASGFVDRSFFPGSSWPCVPPNSPRRLLSRPSAVRIQRALVSHLCDSTPFGNGFLPGVHQTLLWPAFWICFFLPSLQYICITLWCGS